MWVQGSALWRLFGEDGPEVRATRGGSAGAGGAMETIEYTTIDKSDWPDGPWKDEPDKVQWTDESTGLPCLIKRHGRHGNLCGYVGVPEGHPWYKTAYQDLGPVDVHCGVTYSDFCEEGPEEIAICHIPEAGKPDNVWWLGFDCGHAYDRKPAMEPILEEILGRPWAGLTPGPFREVYRALPYVRGECESLAKQIAEAANV